MDKDTNDEAEVAAAILRYIRAHPEACDALEGVTDWWLARQRYEDSHARVATALELLISRGEIEAVEATGGRLIYRAASGSAHASKDNGQDRKGS